MHNRVTEILDSQKTYHRDFDLDTARWTSPAYEVTFGRIAEIVGQSLDSDSFRLSAWGLSAGLCELLADYKDEQLRTALDGLIIRQNAHVVVMLDDAMSNNDFDFEMLDQVFISIDVELFLPRGLRMHVTCVTNIVQVGSDSQMLDKFVAVLDPGEAMQYVRERQGMTFSTLHSRIH